MQGARRLRETRPGPCRSTGGQEGQSMPCRATGTCTPWALLPSRYLHPLGTQGCCVTELQNTTMVQVGRALCGSPSPTPCPSRVTQSRLHRTASRQVLNISRKRRLHNRPGQPVPGLRHPQREEVLPRLQTELPLLPFAPVAPCPVAGYH